MKKILILLKKSNNKGDYNDYNNRGDYNDYFDKSKSKPKAGLHNSARLINEFLNKLDSVESSILETCVDGNDIDNKLFKYKPDICIIEALWVTPEKISELQKLYKNINFIIRIHSKTPFLAMEGIAIQWIKKYVEIPGVNVAFNNYTTSNDFISIGIDNIYLPNVYEEINIHHKILSKIIDYFFTTNYKDKEEYNIGCFGATRPLKNQLNQAVAAIKFGELNNVKINFFINSGRLEQSGENTIKNIRALFEGTRHELIEVGWLERADFLELLKKMDVSMQVSLTETFNIVAADSVYMRVPVVVSDEISWVSIGIADPSSIDSMVDQISKVLRLKNFVINKNLVSLKKYNHEAIKEWKFFIEKF